MDSSASPFLPCSPSRWPPPAAAAGTTSRRPRFRRTRSPSSATGDPQVGVRPPPGPGRGDLQGAGARTSPRPARPSSHSSATRSSAASSSRPSSRRRPRRSASRSPTTSCRSGSTTSRSSSSTATRRSTRTSSKKQGLTDEQVRKDLRTRMLSEKIFEQVTADVEVTDADVETYYDDNKAQFEQPASREVQAHPRRQDEERSPTTSTSSWRTAATSPSSRSSTPRIPRRRTRAASSRPRRARPWRRSTRSRSSSRPESCPSP